MQRSVLNDLAEAKRRRTEKKQHPKLPRVLRWSFKSLLFAAFVLAILPDGVVSIATTDSVEKFP